MQNIRRPAPGLGRSHTPRRRAGAGGNCAHRRGLNLYQYRPQGHRQLLPRRATAPWIGDLPQCPDGPQQIDGTAHDEEPVSMSTYHNPSFCLGMASCELKTQEIIFIAL
ncbi:MAG: hypothetical protein QGI86_10755 [Candidatus Poribacteria bacterium]|nr:hypothetical protein [Candidatus Poribacteria bacterium]MDP6996952.1 hypothetical protein [Candidatus Poribacteria bacterium]